MRNAVTVISDSFTSYHSNTTYNQLHSHKQSLNLKNDDTSHWYRVPNA